MITKAASNNGMTKQEAGWLNTIDACLAEMSSIRRRMKSSDQRIRAAGQRIRRADAVISRCQAETRAIISHVQASR